MYATKIRNLERATKVPYFARVDFKTNETDEKIYIGKTNIFDEDSNVEVADWRAPISSLYYDSRIGEAKYNCPEGTIEGELKLKRIYSIEEGRLLDFSDIDITTNDELLQDCLNENSDARLKNIISTIQSEQNQVIRANMFKPFIIQGVAGSGKTTVALHRIAYLVYTYEKEFNPEDFLIIAPNKFFLDYISNVLPDLGVDYVRQETFEDLAQSIIKEKIKLEDGNIKLAKIVNNNQNSDEIKKCIEASKFKSSISFKEMIDEYLMGLNKNIIDKQDFKIADIQVIKYEEIQNMLMDNYERIPLQDRIDRLSKFMQNRLSNESYNIVDEITKRRKIKLDNINQNMPAKEIQIKRRKIFEETENEINSLLKDGGKKLVNGYIKKIKRYKVIQVYKDIMSNKTLLEKYATKDIADYIEKNFYIKNKFEHEDLAALMYIRYRLLGIEEKFNLKHIVIDEAQDLSEFQFSVIYEILKKNKSMTILGDIAQGIYSYRGTNNWERINNVIFDGEADIKYLERSYRTTKEIMDEANKVLENVKEKLNIKLAIPVARHGENVSFLKAKNFDEKIDLIYEKILNSKRKNYKNIAVIAKDDRSCKEIYEKLKDRIENLQLITKSQDKYEGGVIVIPSYYSKGLEFDCVVVTDFNKYGDSLLDKKLLYVALTRAMHELDIVI